MLALLIELWKRLSAPVEIDDPPEEVEEPFWMESEGKIKFDAEGKILEES